MPGIAGVPTTWPPDEILVAFRAWTEKHGRSPASAEWDSAGRDHPCNKTVKNAFGSFAAGREAAGLTFRRKNHRGDWTRQQVIDAIVQWRFTHGRLPRREQWDVPPTGWPSAHNIERLFGSWSGGLLAAGYRPTHARLSDHSIRARMSAVTKKAA